jgi:phage gp29-like protein
MAQSMIIDTNGNPINTKELKTGIDDAQLTGVRNMWSHNSVASGITPTRLASVLEAAAQGEVHDFLTLAEEMEERDPHYACELSKRKLAVSGIEPTIEAAGDDQRAIDIATEVRGIINSPIFNDLVDGSLDAFGKGYALVQQDWEQSAKQWMPQRFKWRDPRFFALDKNNGYDLRLLTDNDPIFGEELNPYQWLIHRPRIKMGLPIRGALARLASVCYMCKSFGMGDWMTYAEVFGMPVRIGKYHSNATPEEKATLRRAVANIGTDANAIMPESMVIELLERSSSSGGEKLYENLCDWLNKQISKGVLGQTMSAENGSSNAQAQVHNEVRLDICRADIRQLEATINSQVIEPFIKLNYGNQEQYPRVKFPMAEPEDLTALTAGIKEFIPFGLKVPASQIREKFGLREPQEGEEILVASTALTPPEKKDDKTNTVALNNQQDSVVDALDEIQDEASDWKEQLKPIISPLQQLAEDSATEAEFLEGLPYLLQDTNANELIESLAKAAFKARGVGDA